MSSGIATGFNREMRRRSRRKTSGDNQTHLIDNDGSLVLLRLGTWRYAKADCSFALRPSVGTWLTPTPPKPKKEQVPADGLTPQLEMLTSTIADSARFKQISFRGLVPNALSIRNLLDNSSKADVTFVNRDDAFMICFSEVNKTDHECLTNLGCKLVISLPNEVTAVGAEKPPYIIDIDEEDETAELKSIRGTSAKEWLASCSLNLNQRFPQEHILQYNVIEVWVLDQGLAKGYKEEVTMDGIKQALSNEEAIKLLRVVPIKSVRFERNPGFKIDRETLRITEVESLMHVDDKYGFCPVLTPVREGDLVTMVDDVRIPEDMMASFHSHGKHKIVVLRKPSWPNEERRNMIGILLMERLRTAKLRDQAAKEIGLPTVRRREALKYAASASNFVLLDGPSCCGKTRAVKSMAKERRKELVIIPASAEIDVKDFLGSFMLESRSLCVGSKVKIRSDIRRELDDK
jgi:hypothetical protein